MQKLRFIFTFLVCSTFLSAQEIKEKGIDRFSDRIGFGGNMGMSFGNVTYIGINPIAGYRLTERLCPGVGISYSYISIHYNGYPTEESSIFGGSLWLRYYILESVFAYGEYESLNGEWDPYFKPGQRFFLSSMLVGGGYREMFGDASSYFMILYNMTDSYQSPYGSPLLFRVGFAYKL